VSNIGKERGETYMKISYQEDTKVFRLDTAGMTFAMSVSDEEGFLSHL